MSLPAIILKVLSLLHKEGIKAEVYPMYGSCTVKYIITLPGVEVSDTHRDHRTEKIQEQKH